MDLEASARLRSARKNAGFRTDREAADALGLSHTTYACFENGQNGFTRHAVPFSQRFNVSVDRLLTGKEEGGAAILPVNAPALGHASVNELDLPSDLPILGTAAASIIGAVTLGQSTGFLRRPPALLSTPDAYALYVAGDSMEPRYHSDDVVYVNPHRPCRQGDDVVIQTRLGASDDISGYVKTLISRSAKEVVVRQYNPASKIEYRAPTVIAVHRVLSAHELIQG